MLHNSESTWLPWAWLYTCVLSIYVVKFGITKLINAYYEFLVLLLLPRLRQYISKFSTDIK